MGSKTEWTPQRASRRIMERAKQVVVAETWTVRELEGFIACHDRRNKDSQQQAATVWMPVTTRRGVLVKTKRTVRARKTPVDMRDARH